MFLFEFVGLQKADLERRFKLFDTLFVLEIIIIYALLIYNVYCYCLALVWAQIGLSP